MDAALTARRIGVVRRQRRATLTATALRGLRRFAAHVQAGSSAPVWAPPARSELEVNGGRR
jgi:hypothetical protein